MYSYPSAFSTFFHEKAAVVGVIAPSVTAGVASCVGPTVGGAGGVSLQPPKAKARNPIKIEVSLLIGNLC